MQKRGTNREKGGNNKQDERTTLYRYQPCYHHNRLAVQMTGRSVQGLNFGCWKSRTV